MGEGIIDYFLSIILIPLSILTLPFYDDILNKYNKKISIIHKLILAFIFINIPIILLTVLNINDINELKVIIYIIVNILLILLTFFLTLIFSNNNVKKTKKRYIFILLLSSLLITYINFKGLIVVYLNSYNKEYYSNLIVKYKNISLNKNNDSNTEYYMYNNLSFKNILKDYKLVETIEENIKFENKDSKNIILLTKEKDILSFLTEDEKMNKYFYNFLKNNNISDEIELYEYLKNEDNIQNNIFDSLPTIFNKTLLLAIINQESENIIIKNETYNILINKLKNAYIINIKEKNSNITYRIFRK